MTNNKTQISSDIVRLTNQLVRATRQLVNDSGENCTDEVKALRAQVQQLQEELAASRQITQRLMERRLAEADGQMRLRPEDVLARRK